jgi:hypothetical protein
MNKDNDWDAQNEVLRLSMLMIDELLLRLRNSFKRQARST